MDHYAGLDVSMKETAVCVIDDHGKIIHESMEITDPYLIAQALASANVKIKTVGLEAGSISRWLAIRLQELGFETIVIDARLMSGILKVKINKNDKNDARGIAEAIRTNFYKPIHIKSNAHCQLRILLNTRKTLVNQRTDHLLTIRGYLKSEGFRMTSFSAANAEERLSPILKKCSKPLALSIVSLLRILAVIQEEIKNIEGLIKDSTNESDDIKLLQTIPGVGPVIAAAFLSEIDDLGRFPNARTAAAYLGLTPKLYASGDTFVMGRISKYGNSQVRSLLYQAGILILTRSAKWSKLKAWGMKIQKKSGTKKAAVAIARKLATIMFQMLLTRKEFIYGEPKKRTKSEVPSAA